MNHNQRFAELAGIEWHKVAKKADAKGRYYCSCLIAFSYNKAVTQDHCDSCNPDFTDAREVLKVMMEREDWPEFCEQIGHYDGKRGIEMVDVDYITVPGKLRDLATEWMEGRK